MLDRCQRSSLMAARGGGDLRRHLHHEWQPHAAQSDRIVRNQDAQAMEVRVIVELFAGIARDVDYGVPYVDEAIGVMKQGDAAVSRGPQPTAIGVPVSVDDVHVSQIVVSLVLPDPVFVVRLV